jgi:hypothetical protein
MTGTPLTVSPIEVQTIGYPWTYHQFPVIAFRRRYNLTRRREKEREEGNKGGRDEGRERKGHTKLVVPSIGLLSARSPAPAGLSLLDYTLVIQIRRWR